MLKKIMANGGRPSVGDYMLEIDAKSPSFKQDQSFCLTSARVSGGGYWVSSRGRRLRLDAMRRLQGYDPAYVRTLEGVTSRQFAFMRGNGMAVPMVARILYKLLPAAKLAEKKHLNPVWESADTGRARLLQMRPHKLPVSSMKAHGLSRPTFAGQFQEKTRSVNKRPASAISS